MAKQTKKNKTPPKKTPQKKRNTQTKKGNTQQKKQPRAPKTPKKTAKPAKTEPQQVVAPEGGSARHEIQGILFLSLTLLLFVSLVSGQESGQNIAGMFGTFVSEVFFRFFGYIAYAFPLLLLLVSIDRFLVSHHFVNYGNMTGSFVAILSLCALLSLPAFGKGITFAPGGYIGIAVATFLINYFNLFGAIVVIVTGLITSAVLFRRFLLEQVIIPEDVLIQEDEAEPVPQIHTLQQEKSAQTPSKKKLSTTFSERIRTSFKKKKKPKKAPSEPSVSAPSRRKGYQLPPTTLLQKPSSEKSNTGTKQKLLNNSKILEEKLLDFGIEGQVVGVLPGPVITRYEFQPAAGVKVSRIVNLSDDLALGLKAVSIRIVAPVPGKDVVGIEVPNATRQTVYLRSLIESSTFVNHRSRLALAVGEDIAGHPFIADLAKMPHLLIAGATGSGKSVCLNALICSILFHARPEEVRFVMIDPKMLELGVYDGIPHLLIPVVKDPQKAHNAMGWATEEMTRRYRTLARKGVRNIAQYNDAIREERKNQETDEDILPYIVIIVDELADLMMVSSGIEKPITRLAQMARAVGIHLILATQRPSVDVITGVIKANFPARISFRVSSKVDSRTILDTNGAERLLGDGDMLFLLPATSRILRLHGSFLSEKEIKKLTSTLKKMASPDYDHTVLHYAPEGDSQDDDDLEMYKKAAYMVVSSGEASISMLRRSLKIGHSRAARYIDLMQQDGIVGSFRGSRPRDILMTTEQLDERFRSE